jgi:hypothetical protein
MSDSVLNLGISPRQMTLFAGILSAVPNAMMPAFALTNGLVICLMMHNPGTLDRNQRETSGDIGVGALGTGYALLLCLRCIHLSF